MELQWKCRRINCECRSRMEVGSQQPQAFCLPFRAGGSCVPPAAPALESHSFQIYNQSNTLVCLFLFVCLCGNLLHRLTIKLTEVFKIMNVVIRGHLFLSTLAPSMITRTNSPQMKTGLNKTLWKHLYSFRASSYMLSETGCAHPGSLFCLKQEADQIIWFNVAGTN